MSACCDVCGMTGAVASHLLTPVDEKITGHRPSHSLTQVDVLVRTCMVLCRMTEAVARDPFKQEKTMVEKNKQNKSKNCEDAPFERILRVRSAL